jgi:chemotaxis protein MotB
LTAARLSGQLPRCLEADMARLTAFLLLPLLLSSLVGCATTRPDHLPALTPGTSESMVEAHDTARRAYDRCLEDFDDQSVPWPLFLASGTGLLSAAFVGAAVTMAALVPDPATSGGLVAGLGLGAVASAGATAFFGAQEPARAERFSATEGALALARTRAEDAMANNESTLMANIGRELYEDCRTISNARGGEASAIILRDMNRYRRDLESRRTQLDGVTQHQADLLQQNEDLSGRLVSAEKGVLDTGARITGLESKLAAKESANGALRARVTELEDERAKLSKREQKLLADKRKLEAKTSHYEDVAEKLSEQVKDGRVALRRLRDGVVVEMQNQVLFPSGSAQLNDDGKETLAAVAAAIRELADRRVRVEGHTDDVPVGKKNPVGDNWNLSAQRALTVTRFLQAGGVDPSLLSAAARSQYAPVAPNESDETRARNRRIEIYLLPKPVGSSETWAPTGG